MKTFLTSLRNNIKSIISVNFLLLLLYNAQFLAGHFFAPRLTYNPLIDAVVSLLAVQFFFTATVSLSSNISLVQISLLIWQKSFLFWATSFTSTLFFLIAFRFFLNFQTPLGFIMTGIVSACFLFILAGLSWLTVLISLKPKMPFLKNLQTALKLVSYKPEYAVCLLMASAFIFVLSALTLFIFPSIFGIFLLWCNAYHTIQAQTGC